MLMLIDEKNHRAINVLNLSVLFQLHRRIDLNCDTNNNGSGRTQGMKKETLLVP